MRVRQILLCGLVIALLGCAKTKSEVRAAPSGIGLETKVVEQGAEPREQLRYKRVTGLKENLIIEVGLASFIQAGEDAAPVESPVLALGLNIGSTSCTSMGVCTYPISFTVIGVKMPEGATEADAASMMKQMESLAQVTGTYEVDARGITLRADMQIPETVPARVSTLLGNVRTALVSVPLPEEAVGIGARWQVERLHEVAGIKTKQTVTYSLLEKHDRVLRLGLTLQQSATPQQVPFDADSKLDVEAYEVSGTGSVVMSLDAITPLSEVQANSDLRGIVRHGTESETLRMAGTGSVIVAPVATNNGAGN